MPVALFLCTLHRVDSLAICNAHVGRPGVSDELGAGSLTKLEAYPNVFLGRPRGRRVDSSLNLVAVRWTHGASP
jgi:hypothetical protein